MPGGRDAVPETIGLVKVDLVGCSSDKSVMGHLAVVRRELAGVWCLAGHKEVQTTSRYVHPPFEAGKRVNDASLRDTVWDTSEF